MNGSANGHPRDLLSDYLDDELPVEERNGVDRHLASCEDCRSDLAALRLLSRAIAEEGVPPPPTDLGERIGRRLDEATVLRPRRWRFAVPATIAATISAIGILVAIQWREGRLSPQHEERDAESAAEPAQVPPPPPAPQAVAPPGRIAGGKPEERTDASDAREKNKDAARPEQAPEAPARSVATGVEGGVEGGVPGGVVGGAVGGTDAPQPSATVDETQTGRYLQKQASAAPASGSAAKAEAVSVCADRWSDSGARGVWAVPSPVAAAGELNTIAHDMGGVGVWRGADDGRPYLLIVPRGRYLEVVDALRARGVAGLVEPPALAIGDDCTAISVTIVAAR